MVGQMSTSMYLPSLPSLADDLHVEAAGVKMTMTVFLAAFAAAQLFFGPLSDRFGRRPALFLGLGLYLLGTAACAVAPNLPALIVGRFVQGFGACAGPAIARAIVRDRYERAEAARVLAYIGMAMAVGPAVGPILGGFLQVQFGWRANFTALVDLRARRLDRRGARPSGKPAHARPRRDRAAAPGAELCDAAGQPRVRRQPAGHRVHLRRPVHLRNGSAVRADRPPRHVARRLRHGLRLHRDRRDDRLDHLVTRGDARPRRRHDRDRRDARRCSAGR